MGLISRVSSRTYRETHSKMPKHKHHAAAPRVKGNAKSSSSGTAAATLGFGNVHHTFDSLKGSSAFSGSTSPEKAAFLFSDADIDANLKVILRKLQKKDPVTKQKAIAEFLDLQDAQKFQSLLPHWPRMYRSLTVDTDKKVRELSHKAWQHPAGKCGKHVTPYLQEIAPYWIMGSCD